MYEQRVRITDDHRYFHQDGSEYMGFSRLFDEFLCKPFNAEMAALGTARSDKNEYSSKQEVLNKWEAQRDEGTRIDNAITLFADKKTWRQEDEDILDGVKEMAKVYEQYHKSYGQLILFSEKYRVAGTADRISVVSNRKDCPVIVSDFKCFDDGVKYEPSGSKRFLLPPFDYLANTKYVKICFQLSFYSYLFEELTGRVPLRLFIHWIDPRTMKKQGGVLNVKYELIPVPYMRSDVINFLEHYKEKIINLTTVKQVEAW